jgi:hypothetical protein
MVTTRQKWRLHGACVIRANQAGNTPPVPANHPRDRNRFPCNGQADSSDQTFVGVRPDVAGPQRVTILNASPSPPEWEDWDIIILRAENEIL